MTASPVPRRVPLKSFYFIIPPENRRRRYMIVVDFKIIRLKAFGFGEPIVCKNLVHILSGVLFCGAKKKLQEQKYSKL